MTPTEENFWSKVTKTETCWIFATDALNGYGMLYDAETKNSIAAHRYSYELHKGPIPHGLHIDHLCRVVSCVNPDHLEAVTPKENIRRGREARGEKARDVKNKFDTVPVFVMVPFKLVEKAKKRVAQRHSTMREYITHLILNDGEDKESIALCKDFVQEARSTLDRLTNYLNGEQKDLDNAKMEVETKPISHDPEPTQPPAIYDSANTDLP